MAADTAINTLKQDQITDFRAQHIGIIFQNFHLIPHLSALENIMLPLEILERDSVLEIASDLLNKVGLSQRAQHLPSQLSGGEKQRVALARALAISPDLILADEPSGSLDEETGEEVMKLLFDLIKEQKRTMILVTHDKELAARCDKRYLLEHGALHELS